MARSLIRPPATCHVWSLFLGAGGPPLIVSSNGSMGMTAPSGQVGPASRQIVLPFSRRVTCGERRSRLRWRAPRGDAGDRRLEAAAADEPTGDGATQ